MNPTALIIQRLASIVAWTSFLLTAGFARNPSLRSFSARPAWGTHRGVPAKAGRVAGARGEAPGKDSIALGADAPLEVIGACFRPDRPFPEFALFWDSRESSPAAPADSGSPSSGGSIHVFFRNVGEAPAVAKDVFLGGISLRRAIAFSDQRKFRKYLQAASVHFSDLAAAERGKLVDLGEPVWYRVEPREIPPGSFAEVAVRLRRAPAGPETEVDLKTDRGSVKTIVKTTGGAESRAGVKVQARPVWFQGIHFTQKLDGVFAYLVSEMPGRAPQRILLDGRDVTSRSKVGMDPELALVPVRVSLERPLEPGSFHCFQASYADGAQAVAGARAHGLVFGYGMWGGKPGKESELEVARSYLRDLAAHHINLQMEQIGSRAVAAFLKSAEGLEMLRALGIRRLVSDVGKGNVREPFAYFLADEPDAGDSRVAGVPPGEKAGSLAQSLVLRAADFHEEDPGTPTFLNVDMTYKPDNWYIYGQIPDIFAADPYQQARLRQAYAQDPGARSSAVTKFSKATFVHAVGSLCRSACEPRPLHLILYAVAHAGEQEFRPATPEEKRIEAYYAVAAGAKSLSYWWYTPASPARGVGASDPKAAALWREIGLLGAELRTVGPILALSTPIGLPIKSSPRIWTRTLAVGLDTLVILVVNDDYESNRDGITIHPVEGATLAVSPPEWLSDVKAFEVTHEGTKDFPLAGAGLNSSPQASDPAAGRAVTLDLGTVKVTRLIVLTADVALRGRLEKR